MEKKYQIELTEKELVYLQFLFLAMKEFFVALGFCPKLDVTELGDKIFTQCHDDNGDFINKKDVLYETLLDDLKNEISNELGLGNFRLSDA